MTKNIFLLSNWINLILLQQELGFEWMVWPSKLKASAHEEYGGNADEV